MATTINPYRDVHKGIRGLISGLLVMCGQIDNDRDNLDDFHKRFVRLVDLLEIHSQIEDHFLAPLIREAGLQTQVEMMEREHQSQKQTIKELVSRLEQLVANEQDGAVQAFYLAFSSFVAVQLQHMVDEEQNVWPAISRECSDAQIREFLGKARQTAPPAVMRMLLMAMITYTSSAERLAIVMQLQNSMPGDGFREILSATENALSAGNWRKLRQGLGLDLDSESPTGNRRQNGHGG